MSVLIKIFRKNSFLVKAKRSIFAFIQKLFRGLSIVKWMLFYDLPARSGISKNGHETELIASLTSFPARINTVHFTIRSLLMQTEKPDKVILWLAEEQFPGKENILPKQLLLLKKNGLSIEWCSDIKSFKKLIPAVERYPDAIVVTADDDMYYSKNWLKVLYQEYLRDPSCIQSHIVTEFTIKDGKYYAYGRKHVDVPRESFLYKVVGCGGVLYPPHCFNSDITNKDIFMDICNTNDDIWFWLMGVLNGVKIHVPLNNDPRTRYVEHTQEGPTLSSNNDRGENLFWVQFNNMRKYYPQIDRILESENDRVISLRKEIPEYL